MNRILQAQPGLIAGFLPKAIDLLLSSEVPIALGGVWLVNHLDNSSLRMPSWMQASDQTSSPPDHQGSPQQYK